MRRIDHSKASKDRCGFEGQTKAVDVGGTEEETIKRIQTAIGGAREEEMYVTSQGRRETWESVAAIENGRVIEVTVKMRGGMGKKRSKKNRNPWNTPSSESELENSSSTDEMHQQQTQEELQRTVTQRMAQVGMLDRFVEVMAAVGEEEREEMFKRYEAEMPKELGEGYVAASRVAIEKAVREKGDEMERMRKIELIREGVRMRYFRENSGPDDILDCGIHSGRKFEDVYLDHKSYVKWVLELGQPHMWTLRCFRYFLKRLMNLEWTLKEGRDQEQRMREERLEMSESLVEEMALEEKNMVDDFKRVRWADLEDEEQGSWCEKMVEKEETMNKSEALTETQVADGQEDRGEEKERQTGNDGRQQQENTTRADRWNKGGDVIGQQQQEAGRQVTDDEDGDEGEQGGGQKQQAGTVRGKRRTTTTTRHGRAQSKGEGKQSLEELIRIVKLRMQQEEEQEQMNGEDEARRESEAYRKKKESEQEIKWEIGKGKRNGKEKGDREWRGEKSWRNDQARRKGTRRDRDSEGLGRLVARQRSGMYERGMGRIEQ